MTEELLHFIWKYRVFEPANLSCADGALLEVIDPGLHNTDAGPDFFNAKIKIGQTMWAGNVEIHKKASDWFAHNHHRDKSYNNVILHIVLDNDVVVHTENNRQVPVCQLAASPQLVVKYNRLLEDQKWLKCADGIHAVSPIDMANWLERCAVSKLELRTLKIQGLLESYKGDWDQVFFVVLARSFGFGTNADPFEMMARQTPVKILLQHADNKMMVEALLLGQSGLLGNAGTDPYHQKLVREYAFLSAKHGLKPVEGHLFKFLRLRPGNFPTVRLAQMADFICRSVGLWDSFLKANNLPQVIGLLKCAPSDYWKSHYLLGEPSVDDASKDMGLGSIRLVIINAVVPFVFAYGFLRGNETLQQKAMEWLEKLPPEKNAITDQWCVEGEIVPRNAFESQALVHLHNHYCQTKKCLQCRIGHAFLSKNAI